MSEKTYWWEAEAFTYYRVPKALFTNPQYKNLSVEAVRLYGVLLDRTGLSGRNAAAFSDESGRIFIYYTLNEVCTVFGCGHDKATLLFVELKSTACLSVSDRARVSPTAFMCRSSTQTAENPYTPTPKSRIPDCGEIAGNDIYSIYLSSNSLTIRRKRKRKPFFFG